MSDVIKLSDGTTDIDLHYDDSNAGFQSLSSGITFGLPPHEHLWHSSDFTDGDVLVRERLGNRVWNMNLALKSSSSDDAIANQLEALNRLTRQAREYQARECVDVVYLEIQLDGATNWTRYDVVDIQYDTVDIMHYFNRQTGDVKYGDAVTINIVTKPWGYGDWEILENDLRNPHFIHGSGIPHNWNEVGSLASHSRVSTYSKVGGRSFCMETDADGEGIESESTETFAHADRDVVAYAWIYLTTSDTVTVSLRNHTDGTVIDSDTTTTQDEWTRVSVSGTLSTDKAARLRITATSGATVYIDQCYLQLDATTIPSAWMSSAHIGNYYESISEGRINYIDVIDVPGDLDAETVWQFESPSGNNYLARSTRTDTGREFSYWTDFDDDHTSGSRSNNGYDSVWVDTDWTTLGSRSLSGLEPALPGVFNVVVALNCDSETNAKMRLALTTVGRTTYQIASGEQDVILSENDWGSYGYWDGITLGPIYIPERLHTPQLDPTDTFSSYMELKPQIKLDSGSISVNIDFMCLLPVDEQYFIFSCADSLTALLFEDNYGVVHNHVYHSTVKLFQAVAATLGDLPKLYPSKEHRFIHTGYTSSDYDLSSNTQVRIKYRPRTEFLLGT